MIHLYWKNATAEVVGGRHGISSAELEVALDHAARAHRRVLAAWEAGELGYAKLPQRQDYRDAVAAQVERFRGGASDLVVLGIGGSALGNIALQQALNPVTYNLLSDAARGGPRLFVLDNVDPSLVGETLRLLGRRLKTTVVNVISKSGETAETASQFLIVRDLLRKRLGDDAAGRIVATTDPTHGTLHDIAAAEGYATLPVPPDVGGRFSVLSPVGLFSAAMCGIDIDALLGGAAAMGEALRRLDPPENPACVLAAIHHLMFVVKDKPIAVMMPYSNHLAGLADWYRQLFAESLGKRVDADGREIFAGVTPVKALGTTDQHSQLQLYREGPNDKLVVFLDPGPPARDVRIPADFSDVPGLSYLGKVKLSRLLAAERTATEYALAQSQRPSVTIRFDGVDAESVGAFIFFYEYVTSLTGELLHINAYDQPAVELIKKATFALLGRDGFEDLGKEIAPFARADRKYLL